MNKTTIFIACIFLFCLCFTTHAQSDQLDVSPPETIALTFVGDTLVIPLNLINPAPTTSIFAFGLTLKYPAHALEYMGTDSLATLTENWLIVSGKENEPGIVKIGGFNPIPITSSGVLINVLLRCKISGRIDEKLVLEDFSDDISDATTNPGTVSPVELASFAAALDQNSVLLTWQTASETNNLGFEIEKKYIDQSDFFSIGFVAGYGTTAAARDYSFRDENIQPGIIHYRLKQIDTDGTCHHSESISLEVSAPEHYVLHTNFPNPFNPSTTVKYKVPQYSHVQIHVYNTMGQKVKTLVDEALVAGHYTTQWNGRDDIGHTIAPGIFICRMTCDGKSRGSIKMVLAK